jgi:5-formyltetrahydrofolate cyclo-ligase
MRFDQGEAKLMVRERGRRRRAAMSREERLEADRRIVARCQMELDWPGYQRVMVYLPIADQNEVDTWPLVRWVWERWPGIEVYLPRVVGAVLEAVLVTLETAVPQSAWGIPEPVGGAVLEPNAALDMVIIPLLGFDGRGHRVGYGRGFYDRFLVTQPGATRVGLGYECLKVDRSIASEDHDVRLQVVVTERQLYWF